MTVGFSQLSARTKEAIIISLFHEKYQRITPDRAMEDFKFATQQADESFEEWGVRIERLRNKVENFGLTVTWNNYIKKWNIGTRDAYFKGRLWNAMHPTDNRSPVVVDLRTFKQWYNRYLNQQRERLKDKDRGACTDVSSGKVPSVWTESYLSNKTAAETKHPEETRGNGRQNGWSRGSITPRSSPISHGESA